LREELGLGYRIEIDGGVAHDTVSAVVEAGADMLVAGSAIYNKGGAERNAAEFLQAARAAAKASGKRPAGKVKTGKQGQNR
jgi:ribulose-phosphate 3-epimerase